MQFNPRELADLLECVQVRLRMMALFEKHYNTAGQDARARLQLLRARLEAETTR
jgi:hypothetical protein